MTCSDFYTVHYENSMVSYIKASTFRILAYFVKLITLLEKRNARIFEMECHLDNFFPLLLVSSCYQDNYSRTGS